MDLENTSQEDFLKELDKQPEDVFDKPIEVEPKEEVESAEETEQKAKNRRERRLLDKLQAERESNIALATRLQTINEVKSEREATQEAEYLSLIGKIYGDVSPEAREATEILKKAFQGVEQNAEKKAYERYVAEQAKEAEALKQEEKNLDELLGEIEDEHGADFSDQATRQGFLTLLEKVSPKDKDGNIKEYADAETVWELYQSTKEKSSNRAKELSSRSMVRSGASQDSKLETDAMERYLKENGLL